MFVVRLKSCEYVTRVSANGTVDFGKDFRKAVRMTEEEAKRVASLICRGEPSVIRMRA